MDILVIFLSVLLAIVVIGLVFLIIKYKKDQSHWKHIAEENLNIGKEQADLYIKETIGIYQRRQAFI